MFSNLECSKSRQCISSSYLFYNLDNVPKCIHKLDAQDLSRLSQGWEVDINYVASTI